MKKKMIKAFLSYFLFWIMLFLGIYIFRIRNKIKVIGRKNLPRSNRILYVSNHETFIDSLVLGIGLVNKRELLFKHSHIPFNAPDLKNFYKNKVGAFFMKLLKNIPVDRGTKIMEAIDAMISEFCSVLKKHNLLLFFQGGRTRNGIIGDCKRGVAETILRGHPDYIIPIWLEGIQPIMPISVGHNYSKISFGHKGKMIIGKSVDFSDIFEQKIEYREKIELIKTRVRDSVLALKP